MKNPLTFFSKMNTCRPLVSTHGKHVEKYRIFRIFLNHNHFALSCLASLEQLYFSGAPYTRASVQCRYEELFEAVCGAVYCLEKLAPAGDRPLEAVLRGLDADIRRELEPDHRLIGNELVIPFKGITRSLSNRVGGKALNLALIKNESGLSVPPGFAIATPAFERFLDENDLTEFIARLLFTVSPDSPDENRKKCGAIQDRIMASPVPHEVAGAIMNAYAAIEERAGKDVRVAMRSSAIGEDTEASFAGQYATVLNVGVDGLLEAYKTVIASVYSDKAVSYRMRYGLEDRETPMCVAGIVMINARASGVMYTRDLSAPHSDALRINSLWGLGERLVDGSASPDAFIVDRRTNRIESRVIAVKEQRLVNNAEGGTRLESVPEKDRNAPSLSDEDALLLAAQGLRIERFFGAPQDIEWALDDQGRLFILQARPLSMSEATKDQEPLLEENITLPLVFFGGVAVSPGIVSASACVIREGDDADHIPDNCIVVARTASPDYARLAGRIRGIITDIGSVTSHLGSVVREFGIPAIFDAKNATSRLSDGMLITLDASRTAVYQGAVDRPAAPSRLRNKRFIESPLHRRTRRILDLISPLNLIDPSSPDFTPKACRTIHDVIRYTHEAVIKNMFGLTDEADVVRSVRLTATIPFILRLVDLGGGIRPGLTTCDSVTPEDIDSIPLKALWKGFTHPGITWEGTINFDPKHFLTLIASSATSEFGSEPGGTSYAILSADYANLSMKFGYHFAVIDTLCGNDSSQNYLALQFAGGAGSYFGRSLRIALLANILKRLGFEVVLKGDLLEASLMGYDQASLEDKLDQTGRLLASSRLLDMTLSNQGDIETLSDAFFREEYDFLSARKGGELAHFYTHGGWWKRSGEDGFSCLCQDGSRAGFRISAGVAGLMGKLAGPALQDFLDAMEAYYYFPLAIVKNSGMSDGMVSVRVKPVSGRIDRAGGLAFGLRNVSNYFVLRLNALEGNIILFEFVNSKRVERASTKQPIAAGQWHTLAVAINGPCMEGFLNGKKILEYRGGKPVSGFVGLWTKADSVTCFTDLTVRTGDQSRSIELT